MEPIDLQLDTGGSGPPDANPHNIAMEIFAKEVEEMSGGKITGTVHHGGTLMPANELLSGTGSGLADMSILVASFQPQELPISAWFAPFAANFDRKYPTGWLQGSAATNELFRSNPQITEEYAEHNLKVLGARNAFQAYDFTCTKPVETLEQAQGISARTTGPVWANEATALGMTPITMPSGEVYEALQRGTIDCSIDNGPIALLLGATEVAKHHTPVSMSGMNGNVIVFNLDRWNSLPPEAQEIIDTAAQNLWDNITQMWLEKFAAYAETAPEIGIEVHDPTEFNKVLAKVQKEAIAKMETELPASVADSSLLDQYRTLSDQWLDIVENELGIEGAERTQKNLFDLYKEAAEIDLTGYFEVVHERSTAGK
ncbi:MAG: C4-dicarboxylate TRAP transporter substrate-binding protein [Mycetocola sp.]